MTGFGDKDLFDVWDDVDPIDVRLFLLARIVADLLARAHDEHRHREALRLLRKLLAELEGRWATVS